MSTAVGRLWTRLVRGLGFEPPLDPREPEGFALTPEAASRLAHLPPGQALHVSTGPASGGRVVQVWEAPLAGATRPGLGVVVTPEDLDRLCGLRLDWADDRWSIRLSLRVDARETPNPDSRLYLADRPLARGRPLYFTPGPAEPALVARLLAVADVRSVLLRDHTATLERRPGASWEAIDAGVDTALREHFLSCGAEVVAEERARLQDPLEEAVRNILLEQVVPAVHRDGGDIELVHVQDGVVRVHMVGACKSCPASTTTLKLGVEQTLKRVLGDRIIRVEAV
jgi:Fe-S cluster biogenesis protein NfuA